MNISKDKLAMLSYLKRGVIYYAYNDAVQEFQKCSYEMLSDWITNSINYRYEIRVCLSCILIRRKEKL